MVVVVDDNDDNDDGNEVALDDGCADETDKVVVDIDGMVAVVTVVFDDGTEEVVEECELPLHGLICALCSEVEILQLSP